jgi:2-polyprenyl-3-methyl-5-hydroxy-6-metoxy-1,4-benzoquinol methylase
MTDATRRPFYAEYAWAFDLLIDRPVRTECGAVAAWLVERHILPGAALLDAGCGTGRYAQELARRGYVVHGIDASPELIAVATHAAGEDRASLSFALGDILALPARRYDAILCRGVLNDLVDEEPRTTVFAAFAQALRPAGVLVLDVREWEASAERKAAEPLFRKRVATERGTLTFTSITRVDHEHRTLLLSEQHTLLTDGQEQSSDYAFAMRCWTRQDLEAALADAGFGRPACFGAYDPDVAAGSTDRLVAVTQLLATDAHASPQDGGKA